MRCSNVAAEATRGVRGTPSSRFHSYTTPRRHDQNGVGWGDSDVFDEERVWIYLADERGEGRVTVDQAVLTEVLERAFLDPRRDDEGGYAIHFFFFWGGEEGGVKRGTKRKWEHASDVPETKSVKGKRMILPVMREFCVDEIVARRDANRWRDVVCVALYQTCARRVSSCTKDEEKIKIADARHARQR